MPLFLPRFGFLPRVAALSTAAVLAYAPMDTFAQEVRLPAAFHKQEHSLSCEVATLKMALGVHGIDITESELIAKLPFDSTPRGDGIWGDPNEGFVGSINGRMLTTGYGVYWDPIAKLGNQYAQTTVLRHSSAPELAKHIAAGDPVIIWGNYGRPSVHLWRTPAGKVINAVNGEHTRVVYGFDGPVGAPTRFYLLDPLIGPHSWSTAQLMDNWGRLGHMGVVVSKNPRWVRIPGQTQVWEISRDGKARHWVTTWATLFKRGGASLIRAIDAPALNSYSVGRPIE